MIAQERPRDTAAIANRFAAEIYDLEIIKDEIQDSANNRTRFLIIAKEDGHAGGNKCSAVFSTNDKAGALFRTLEIFARAGINLTRIESVPDKPGDYAIFLDFDGSATDPAVAGAITEAGGELATSASWAATSRGRSKACASSSSAPDAWERGSPRSSA